MVPRTSPHQWSNSVVRRVGLLARGAEGPIVRACHMEKGEIVVGVWGVGVRRLGAHPRSLCLFEYAAGVLKGTRERVGLCIGYRITEYSVSLPLCIWR